MFRGEAEPTADLTARQHPAALQPQHAVPLRHVRHRRLHQVHPRRLDKGDYPRGRPLGTPKVQAAPLVPAREQLQGREPGDAVRLRRGAVLVHVQPRDLHLWIRGKVRADFVVEFRKLFAVPAPRRVKLDQDVGVRVRHVRIDRLRRQVGDDGFGVHVRSQMGVEPLHRGREREISAEPGRGRVRHPGGAIVPVVVAEQRDVRGVGHAEGGGEALVSFGVDRPEDEVFIGGPGIGMAGSSSSSSSRAARVDLFAAVWAGRGEGAALTSSAIPAMNASNGSSSSSSSSAAFALRLRQLACAASMTCIRGNAGSSVPRP
mmetsp:Transcript_5406/g.22147  ORF Transcript_5406/g.22147 Transcript_5406/m.22147 type:complete len:317 (+) Transcript_5406:725-1675(+)